MKKVIPMLEYMDECSRELCENCLEPWNCKGWSCANHRFAWAINQSIKAFLEMKNILYSKV